MPFLLKQNMIPILKYARMKMKLSAFFNINDIKIINLASSGNYKAFYLL